MRTLRLSLVGTVILALLGGLGGVVAARSDGPDPMAPAFATIEPTILREVSEGTEHSTDEGLYEIDGVRDEGVWESSDPRLSGTVTSSGHWIGWVFGSLLSEEFGTLQVESNVYELVNDGGRWVGPATAIAAYAEGDWETIILRGEDGYEGLTAYVSGDMSTDPPKMHALIFPGEMPAPPEPMSTD